jgi:hypothetical protein
VNLWEPSDKRGFQKVFVWGGIGQNPRLRYLSYSTKDEGWNDGIEIFDPVFGADREVRRNVFSASEVCVILIGMVTCNCPS